MSIFDREILTRADTALGPAVDNGGGMATVERIWQAIKEHKFSIAAIIAAFLIGGLVLTLLQQPMYVATARVQINPQDDKVTNVESLEADAPADSLEFYQTQYALLGARSLAERVARELRLANDDDFFAMYGVQFDDAQGGSATDSRREDRDRRLAAATDVLLAHVIIDPLRRSSLVDISFESPSPVFSAEVANSWVKEFEEQTLDRRYESTANARRFLEGRLNDLRERLEQSERELIQFAAKQNIVTLSSARDPDGRTINQRTIVEANLELLNGELATAKAARVKAQSQLGGSTSSEPNSSTEAIANLRQRRALVSSERANLLSRFEPGYPDVQALTSQINDLDRAIAMEQGRVRSEAQEAYREALAREQQIQNQLSQLENGFQRQRQASIQYQISTLR